ncbi:MAG: hypothetical protein CMM01_08975 [Rhodopirellula sp.]|nr:hypothetical protein [Rhodopirellula sp.]
MTASHIVPTSLFTVCLMLLPGCRLCSDYEDIDYPAYGGSWQRTVRDSGRVGSVFDSAGGKVAKLIDRDQPLPTDAQERQQQGLRTEGMFDPENTDSSPDQDSYKTTPPMTPEDLKNQSLDDIPEGEEGKKLRLKSLDEINVRRIPDAPPSSFIR